MTRNRIYWYCSSCHISNLSDRKCCKCCGILRNAEFKLPSPASSFKITISRKNAKLLAALMVVFIGLSAYELKARCESEPGNRQPIKAFSNPLRGATARCNNGTFSFSSDFEKICRKNGGVLIKLVDFPVKPVEARNSFSEKLSDRDKQRTAKPKIAKGNNKVPNVFLS